MQVPRLARRARSHSRKSLRKKWAEKQVLRSRQGRSLRMTPLFFILIGGPQAHLAFGMTPVEFSFFPNGTQGPNFVQIASRRGAPA